MTEKLYYIVWLINGDEIDLANVNLSVNFVSIQMSMSMSKHSCKVQCNNWLQSMTKYYLLINATIENYVNITGANATTLDDNVTQIRQTHQNNCELSHPLSANTTYSDDNGAGLHYILGVATLLVSALTVVGNGSLLWVILKTSQLRTITNSFIVSLAVSDVTVGFLIMPYCAGKRGFSKCRDFSPIRLIRWIGQNHLCMNRIQLQPQRSAENILA